MERICRYLLSRLSKRVQVSIAEEILVGVLASTDDSITDGQAQRIIETVVKSSGNKVVDFLIKDK